MSASPAPDLGLGGRDGQADLPGDHVGRRLRRRPLDWSVPDEELAGFINELERPARTYLYGRRMYEAMLYWETAHTRDPRKVSSISSRASGQARDIAASICPVSESVSATPEGFWGEANMAS